MFHFGSPRGKQEPSTHPPCTDWLGLQQAHPHPPILRFGGQEAAESSARWGFCGHCSSGGPMEKRCGGCGTLGFMLWNTLWGRTSKTILGSAWRHWWLADLLLHEAVAIQGPWGSGQQSKRSRVQPAHPRGSTHTAYRARGVCSRASHIMGMISTAEKSQPTQAIYGWEEAGLCSQGTLSIHGFFFHCKRYVFS